MQNRPGKGRYARKAGLTIYNIHNIHNISKSKLKYVLIQPLFFRIVFISQIRRSMNQNQPLQVSPQKSTHIPSMVQPQFPGQSAMQFQQSMQFYPAQPEANHNPYNQGASLQQYSPYIIPNNTLPGEAPEVPINSIKPQFYYQQQQLEKPAKGQNTTFEVNEDTWKVSQYQTTQIESSNIANGRKGPLDLHCPRCMQIIKTQYVSRTCASKFSWSGAGDFGKFGCFLPFILLACICCGCFYQLCTLNQMIHRCEYCNLNLGVYPNYCESKLQTIEIPPNVLAEPLTHIKYSTHLRQSFSCYHANRIPQSTQITCPYCFKRTKTEVNERGLDGITFLCPCLFCLCYDLLHTCQHCKKEVGKYENKWCKFDE